MRSRWTCRQATVVTLYLLNEGNLKLRPTLQSKLRPGARIVSHQFGMGNWPPTRTEAFTDSLGAKSDHLPLADRQIAGYPARMPFALHPQLAADTFDVTRLALSAVRLMNDRTWPWLVLVPEREGAVELIDLDAEERPILIEEIALASTVLRDLFRPDKLNVAALGNQVGQLHVHVIARRYQDPAWPRPVWGTHAPVAYGDHDA